MSTQTQPDTTKEQQRIVAREIALRRSVYPRRVAAGLMKQEQAERELAGMQSVYHTLQEVRRLREAIEKAICLFRELHDTPPDDPADNYFSLRDQIRSEALSGEQMLNEALGVTASMEPHPQRTWKQQLRVKQEKEQG